MEMNGMFFFKNGKERNVPNLKERSAQPCWWLFSWGQGVLYYHQNFTTPTFTPSLIHHQALKLSLRIAPVNQLPLSASSTFTAMIVPFSFPSFFQHLSHLSQRPWSLAPWQLPLRERASSFEDGGNRTRDCYMAAWRAKTLAPPIPTLATPIQF